MVPSYIDSLVSSFFILEGKVMEKFKSLSKESVDITEAKILEKWKNEDILTKCIENRKDAPYFVFYDGPATANGHPGLHHMVA